MKRDWNYERYRTRDRLLEYDPHIMPPRPHSAGLAYIYPLEENPTASIPITDNVDMSIIYPWENNSITILANELWRLAAATGYEGEKNTFINNFGAYYNTHESSIIFGTLATFPSIGSNNYLYFDTDTKILYHWNEDEYEPINAMLIVDTILNGGDATNI